MRAASRRSVAARLDHFIDGVDRTADRADAWIDRIARRVLDLRIVRVALALFLCIDDVLFGRERDTAWVTALLWIVIFASIAYILLRWLVQ